MRTTRKMLSLFLAFVMVVNLLPTTGFAAAEQEEVVYLSITYEGEYLLDTEDNRIMNVAIPLDVIAQVDLDDYGLSNMWYDKAYNEETKTYAPTALQLIIYAHEELYGGQWGDVSFDNTPGRSYFQNGVFGFTQNLIYFLNGKFPIDRDLTAAIPEGSSMVNIGATSDHIILQPGDRIDMTSFACWQFYVDDAGGFDTFVDDNGEFVYEFTAETETELPLNMKQSFCDLDTGRVWEEVLGGVEIFCGEKYGEAEGSVKTNGSGKATVTFSEAGTYYLWTTSRKGITDDAHQMCAFNSAWPGYCLVSTPVTAMVTVTEASSPAAPAEPQNVSDVLDAAMEKLAATVTAPTFGTGAGEWTVFALARGGHFNLDDKYFTDYYSRIVETVNTQAAAHEDKNGALDTISTENSRLIVALSAIGKDATSVGDWNLITPYHSDNMYWIGKQGINGIIWSLIALDSNNYELAANDNLRQTLVELILERQHDDGGWSLRPQKDKVSNVDITGMTLVALYPYKNQPEVAEACAKAIEWLSSTQSDDGGFAYSSQDETEAAGDQTASAFGTAESCAWAIVALTQWGINPDTDERFVKNGNSAVDNLLSYYLEEKGQFEHQHGGGANDMATDQATYALVAYDRFINGEKALFDYSDVTFDKAEAPDGGTTDSPESDEMTATLGLPAQINPGDSFNATISINNWDNEAGYKLLDMIVNVPNGVSVTDVTPGSKLTGGEVSWNLEEAAGKLRIVYFDANKNSDLTMAGGSSSAELMTIKFATGEDLDVSQLKFSLDGMSLKKSSESTAGDSMAVVDTDYAKGTVTVVQGISFSAVCLYEGDGIDLIPSTKKAVAVAVTGLGESSPALTYTEGTNNIEFKYSAEISEKTDIPAYVALVSASIAMENFADADNYKLDEEETAADLTFGDSNGDGVINAQDALAAVDCWLRKAEVTDNRILSLNVNGDSRLNTFDALGIVEAFVNGIEYGIVTKAATITTKQ